MQGRLLLISCIATIAHAQSVTIPDGTKIRVRLDQTISSATASEGQTVDLSVTENVKVNDTLVIAEGARVTGTVLVAQEKRRMGRAGKLDFSVDRVRAADGEWIPLRYVPTKKTGESHATRNGIITAGVAVVFWPAAPFVLLAKGKDVNINKGVIFDVFTDQNHIANLNPAGHQQAVAAVASHSSATDFQPATAAMQAPPLAVRSTTLPVTQTAPVVPQGVASVTIASSVSGADIEVDGAFVGSTPTTMRLAAGSHTITVRSGGRVWQRTLQVTPDSNVNINASFSVQAPRAVSN